MKTLPSCILSFLLISLASLSSSAQDKVYFVDGFHGGVYGHYPLDTYTKDMADWHDNFPEWRMCLEIEPETWDSVAVHTPAEYARFQRIVAESPRVEYTNPSYAQPYCYNISGESLIRQFEYGIRKLHQHFPEMKFNSYGVEEPCFTSALPMILKGFGFKYASVKCPNTCWGGYSAAHGGELVKWTGPDGSFLLASPRHEVEELGKNVWTTIANDNNDEYLDACRKAGFKHPVGMTYQDAGWRFGPWIGYGDSCRNSSIYCTWTEYFENICTDVEPEEYIFSQEDCLGSLMWGSQVLQRIAQEVRSSETNVTTAEKLSVMANIENGFSCDARDIDEAWRLLMLSQHHDSWIVPYNGLQGDGTWATHIADWTEKSDRLSKKVGMMSLYSFAPKGKGPAVLRVYNSCAERRNEIVSMSVSELPYQDSTVITDAGGKAVESVMAFADGEKKLFFRADVPSFGYTTYKFGKAAGSRTADFKARSVKSVENDMYRIEFDPKRGGVIRSIRSKADGNREMVSRDKGYSFGEMRGFFYDEGVYHSSTESRATVTLVEDNGMEKKVRICGMIATHPFTQTLTLRSGDPVIDCDLTIDWKSNVGIGAYRQKDAYDNPERAFYDERGKLNMYFPSVAEGGKLFKNAPFDVCESKLDNTVFTNWHDIKHNIILNWLDVEGADGSVALFSDHTTSYSYGDTPLALTIQYSGNGLWAREYGIDGPTHIHYAILPHNGDWKEVEKRSIRWNEALICAVQRGADAVSASFIDLADSGFELSAAHMSDGKILIRLYNSCGDNLSHRISLDRRFTSAQEVDLNGTPVSGNVLKEGSESKTLDVQISKFGIKTFILSK